MTQTFSYTLPGMLSRVVTENKNGSNVVTSRTRVDYDYTSTGIRSLSVDWNDANLNNSFATSERTGSVEYLVDSTNHTGYAQTIVETTKNSAGVATKRIVYTYGSDEISQTTYLPTAGGGAGWNAGTTLTFSHDAHTSVQMLTDAAGAIAQVFTYAAYGELIAIHNRIAQSVGTVGAQGLQSQALTSLLYNGEAFDSRIGQLYLRARWYDGHRFTTLDPYFGNGSDPLSFNKYGFVHANPIHGIDPSGLHFSLGGMLSAVKIGAGIGGMSGYAYGSVNAAIGWFSGRLSARQAFLSILSWTVSGALVGAGASAGLYSIFGTLGLLKGSGASILVLLGIGGASYRAGGFDDLMSGINSIVPPWPIGASRQLETEITVQSAAYGLPPELVASVLTAEQLDYNIGDWAIDDEQWWAPDKRSIGVAQIRVDEITRFEVGGFNASSSKVAIRDALLDNKNAISILSSLLRRHLDTNPSAADAASLNQSLANWDNLSYASRDAIVLRFCRAKDNGGFVGGDGLLGGAAEKAFRLVREDGRFAPAPRN